jgi:spermidine/putrescine transport system permease protein
VTTVIGMVYCYYPFMLLPLYISMSSIKTDLLEASADLGADTLTTLRVLIIPSCFSEIIFSSGIVGLMAFGEFAIPQLLGGSKYAFWGSVITSKFINQYDFKTGAAFTFLGLATICVITAVIYLLWNVFLWVKHYNNNENLVDTR